MTDSKWRLWLVGLGLIAVLGGAAVSAGGMYLGTHESDVLHLADLIGRMTMGQRPSTDFMTPIGVLALAPIAAVARLGFGLGLALPLAQMGVALVLLPFAIRASGRFSVWPRYAFVASVVAICLALVYGGVEGRLSASMYYNRWAWGLSYIVLALAILPARPGHEAHRLDGAIMGGGLALLLMIKVTYVVAFAPVVAVALLIRRDKPGLLAALACGLAVLGVATLLLGVDYWQRYLAILQTVQHSFNRSSPGADFTAVAAGPTGLLPTFLALTAAVIARREGRMNEGLILLIFVPAAIYVTYQNFGNDPQWLVLFALIALELSTGLSNRSRNLMRGIGLAAGAIAAPSLINTTLSPFHQLGLHDESYVPVTSQPGAMPILSDIWIAANRQDQVQRVSPLDPPMPPDTSADPSTKIARLHGEALPQCEIYQGSIVWNRAVAADLTNAGYAGRAILLADVLDDLWLFGDFRPVTGSWPWFYGDVSAVANADFVVVPLCPHRTLEMAEFLRKTGQEGPALTEVRRTPYYILLETGKKL